MGFDLFGFLEAAMEIPHFGTPVFKRGDDKSLYSQRIGKSGLIEEFAPVAREEAEQLLVRKDMRCEEALETGSIGHYAFFLSQTEGVFGDRPSVESFIEDNMERISCSAIANLQALRFIGCSRSKELEAVERLSQIFENLDVRRRFLAVERSLLPVTEMEERIDELIDDLSSSPNFATTHGIISVLQKFQADFKPRHFKMAMRACLSNTQVYWIASDDDVRNFTRFLIEEGNLKLSDHANSILEG